MAKEIIFKVFSIISGIFLIGLSVFRFFKLLPKIKYTQFILNVYYMYI